MRTLQQAFLSIALANVAVLVYLLTLTRRECQEINTSCSLQTVCATPAEVCTLVTHQSLFTSMMTLFTLIFIFFIVRAYNQTVS